MTGNVISVGVLIAAIVALPLIVKVMVEDANVRSRRRRKSATTERCGKKETE